MTDFAGLIASGAKAVESGDAFKGLQLYERAAQVCPEAWFGIAGKEFENGELQSSLAKFGQVVRFARSDRTKAAALNSMGMILTRLGKRDEAIPVFLESHSLWREASNLNNIATSYQWKQNHKEAIKWFSRAVDADPLCHEASFGRALSKLVSGDWLGGWQDYESRWKKKTGNCRKPAMLKMPEWSGQSLTGKTLLVYLEQGAGDTIMMLRYLPEVRKRGGKVAIVAGQGLKRLIESNNLADRIVEDMEKDAADCCISTMSLPRLFQTTPQNVPPCGYIKANPRPREGEKKIGLVWAGSADHVNDSLRSIQIEAFATLVPHGTFYSLQKGHRELDLMLTDLPIQSLSGEIKDFQDTAEIIAGLDLVVACDTSVIHLAGAMNKPVWALIPFAPDWRWGESGESTPWYPSMRLFRQPKEGDWATPIQRIADALTTFA